MNFDGPLTSTEAPGSGPNNVEPNPVLDPNARINTDDENNESLNDYTTKMSNINEKLNLTPEQEAFHQQCDREVGPPLEHTTAGRLELQNPSEGTIPPLKICLPLANP